MYSEDSVFKIEDLIYDWIFGNLDDNRFLRLLLPYPCTEMEAYTIAEDFRSAL